jgi:hypothetical protein
MHSIAIQGIFLSACVDCAILQYFACQGFEQLAITLQPINYHPFKRLKA